METPTGPSFVARHAQLLVDYCLDLQSNEIVLIDATTLALPLVRAVHNAALERGAWPILHIAYPEMTADFYAHAQALQLDAVSPTSIEELRSAHAYLRIISEGNTTSLGTIRPEDQTRYRRALQPMAELRRQKKWALTLYPTDAYARDAGMSLANFEYFVEKAMFLDRPDPVTAWHEVHTYQTKLIEQLSRAREIRLEATGTDLTLRVDGRIWQNSSGRRNMPSGEVFTGPIEDSANGHVRFTIPSNVSGVEVSGAELEFHNGVVVSARATTGEAYLLQALETDPGARRLGEIGIGTNLGITQAIKNILFDEKIGGTVHLALGSSYLETGGLNKSALHWDLILDMRIAAGGGRIWLDGELFAENGTFQTL